MSPGERYGLLANTQDAVIQAYFAITTQQLQNEILAMQAAMSPAAGQAAYLISGTGHVLLGAPTTQTSTGVVLSTWVAQWANGDPAWANAGP
jgi:hypothetical protein